MWLCPAQMLVLTVDNGAFPHILNGADLMAPGVQLKLEDFPDFDADQPIGIAVPCGKYVILRTLIFGSANSAVQSHSSWLHFDELRNPQEKW